MLAGVGGEALDERLQLLDLLLVLLVDVLLLAGGHLGVLVPEVVVADIHLDLAEVDVADVRADLIEEVAVMADDDDRIGELQQEVLQPAHGLDVEVVGRLVQQQDVWIAEERLRQQDLDLLAAVHLAHELVLHVKADAQAGEDHLGVALGVPSVQLRELALQHAGALAVRIGKVLLRVELVLFLHDLIQALVAHDDRLEHLVLVKLKVILLEHGHALARRDDDLAGGGLQIAGEHLEEGGLARTVGADDAVAVAGCELDVDVFEQRLAAVGQGHVLRCDHLTLISFSDTTTFIF